MPCLNVNDLLRLRGVCKDTRALSEDYLRRHPRSHGKIHIIRPEQQRYKKPEMSNQPLPLWIFQGKDEACSIRIPTDHLELTFVEPCKIYENIFFPKFLDKYGSQIQRVTVSSLQIPMGEKEWDFFAKLVNLKRLVVGNFSIDSEKTSLPPPPGCNTFLPASFKKLKSFEISRNTSLATVKNCEMYWRLIEQCTDLETIPWFPQDPEQFRKLWQILKRGTHRKLKHCCVKSVSNNYWENAVDARISELCVMCINFKLKLVNANSDFLLGFERTQLLEVVAPQVSTIDWCFQDAYEFNGHVSLPNVEQIHLFFRPNDFVRLNTKSGKLRNSRLATALRNSLSQMIFPSLRKLEISAIVCTNESNNTVLALVWRWLPNLEEVVFSDSGGLNNVPFIGVKRTRPFLVLESMDKLLFSKFYVVTMSN